MNNHDFLAKAELKLLKIWKQVFNKWGLHSTCFSPSAAAPGSITSIPIFFRRKIIDVAEVNQRSWFEKLGQWLENVDLTHLVLVNGKVSEKVFNKLAKGLSNLK